MDAYIWKASPKILTICPFTESFVTLEINHCTSHSMISPSKVTWKKTAECRTELLNTPDGQLLNELSSLVYAKCSVYSSTQG